MISLATPIPPKSSVHQNNLRVCVLQGKLVAVLWTKPSQSRMSRKSRRSEKRRKSDRRRKSEEKSRRRRNGRKKKSRTES